jgi:very-short-patch-repair endonuclease
MKKEFVEELIRVEHWGKGKSIRLIERENGIGTSTLNNWCRIHGVPIKSRIQSIRDNSRHVPKPIGEKHWSKKRPDLFKDANLKASKRMIANNPSRNIDTVIKGRDTLSKRFKENPTPHEILFGSILDQIGITYKTQERILTYNPDFIIANTLIELDGRGHASRATKDAIRDKLLCQEGFNVVRVVQDCLWDKRRFPDTVKPIKLLTVIKKYVPSIDLSNLDPSFSHGQYRVLVREAHTASEVIY